MCSLHECICISTPMYSYVCTLHTHLVLLYRHTFGWSCGTVFFPSQPTQCLWRWDGSEVTVNHNSHLYDFNALPNTLCTHTYVCLYMQHVCHIHAVFTVHTCDIYLYNVMHASR